MNWGGGGIGAEEEDDVFKPNTGILANVDDDEIGRAHV